MKIDLSKCVSSNFKELFKSVKKHEYTHYMLKGGRGSTKSSAISILIPLLMLQNPDCHVVIVRKVGNTLKNSVYNQILWGINKLGIEHMFNVYKSPLKIVLKSTGQEINFIGCDDPTKSKGITVPFGRIGIVWYEELDQFTGMSEIRSMTQSFIRKSGNNWIFYTFNPPKSKNNWVNEEQLINREDRLIHHSTYLEVPHEWLGEQFIIEAEHLKKTRLKAYEHEYLGEVTGTGGNVFENVVIRTITDEEIATMDRFYHGNDFGFTVDPNAYGKFYYHNRKLYVLDEIYEPSLKLRHLAERLKNKGIKNEYLACDCAEPRSIAELVDYGINAIPCKKGPDSVEYGIRWLQNLDAIIIDKNRTPNAAKEFLGYEYDRNKDGQFISRYPDKNNHFIDCTRYALESLIKINNSGWNSGFTIF